MKASIASNSICQRHHQTTYNFKRRSWDHDLRTTLSPGGRPIALSQSCYVNAPSEGIKDVVRKDLLHTLAVLVYGLSRVPAQDDHTCFDVRDIQQRLAIEPGASNCSRENSVQSDMKDLTLPRCLYDRLIFCTNVRKTACVVGGRRKPTGYCAAPRSAYPMCDRSCTTLTPCGSTSLGNRCFRYM